MALVFDPAIGGEFSNSYCDKAFADAYASNQYWQAAWFELSGDAKLVALMTSTGWMETLPYGGNRCSATQALAWPRSNVSCDGVAASCDVIPLKIRQAQVQLAYRLSQDPNAIVPAPGGGGTPSGVFVSKSQLGDLSQEFTEYKSADSSCDNCGDPALLSALPWLEDLIACYLSTSFGSSKVLLRVRS